MGRSIYWDETKKSLFSSSGFEFRKLRGLPDDFEATFDEATNISVADLTDALREVKRSNPDGPREINFAIRRDVFSESTDPFVNELLASTTFNYEFFDLGPDGILRYYLEFIHKDLKLRPDIESQVGPILDLHGIEMEQIYFGESGGEGPFYSVTMRPNPRSSLLNTIQIHATLAILICYPRLAPNSIYGAYSLIKAGCPDALIGQPESPWLEVKQKGYGLENPRQQYELALDVASFANTYDGGMVVVGATTCRDSAGRDVISSVDGCKQNSLPTSRYIDVLNRLVFPKIQNLEVHLQTYLEKTILMIHVPRQSAENKPFLVRGFKIDESRVRGTAITIPSRIGDAKSEISIEELHRSIQRGMIGFLSRVNHAVLTPPL